MNVEPLRKILPYTGILVILAGLYTAYTFYSRRNNADLIERQQKEKKVEADRDSVERMGGVSLKITGFYANPPVLRRGQPGELCYGVVNAKEVSLAPAVERVWPSLSRCFPVSPKNTTHYTLSARDPAGRSVEQSLDVTVQ